MLENAHTGSARYPMFKRAGHMKIPCISNVVGKWYLQTKNENLCGTSIYLSTYPPTCIGTYYMSFAALVLNCLPFP